MYPEDLKYHKEHTWVRVDGVKGTVGITYYAQEQLGDVIYLELPQIGADVKAGTPFGTIESAKSVSELFAPVSGRVTAVNQRAGDNPSLVNIDPYGDGWLIKVEILNPAEIDQLLTAQEYRQYVEGL